jgi:ABC-type multidrug transport system fused ATPase/permease subunit
LAHRDALQVSTMDARKRSGNLRRFLAYLKPYRGWLLLSTLVGVAKDNLPVVFPWILKGVIDILVGGHVGAGANNLTFNAT